MKNLNLFRYFSKRNIIIMVLLKLFLSSFNMLVSLMMQLGLENIYSSQGNSLPFILAGLVAGVIAYSIFYYSNALLLEKNKKRIMEAISLALIKENLMSERKNDDTHIGEVLNLINEDTETVGNYFIYGFFPAMDMIMTLIFGFGYMFLVSFKAGIFYIFIGLSFYFFSKKVEHKASIYKEKYMDEADFHNRFYEEVQKNIPVIKIYSVAKFILSRHKALYNNEMNHFKKVATELGKSSGLFLGGVYLVEILSLIGGVILVSKGELSTARMIGIWNVGIGSILYPFLDMPSITDYMSSQKAAVSRIFKHLDMLDTKAGERDLKTGETKAFQDSIENRVKAQTEIAGRGIRFNYPDSEKAIFDNFSFTVTDEKINYIIGKNGSGKTTLMEIMLGILKPSKGEVYTLINGKKSARDVKSAYIPKNNEFFRATILENLTLGEELSKERVADVLNKVGIAEKIHSLPDGLETVFGEDTSFSLGELRRLSIARGILAEPDFIFLDEPFSDLDTENQKNLMELFKSLKGKTGIVIITHTFDFVTENDNIIEIGKDGAKYEE